MMPPGRAVRGRPTRAPWRMAPSSSSDVLLPVPVLTLNYLPDEVAAPPALYQFALSPEDEAVSAAERAVADGYSRCLLYTSPSPRD